jgi:ABC-type cobalamin/Fe3+-siderophores transport system ATPase subunit
VVVLHQLDDALHFTDDALLLDRGHAVASGLTAEVVCPEHIEPTYGVKLVQGEGLAFRLDPEATEVKATK